VRYEQIAYKIIVEAFCCNGSCLGRHENRRALGVVASYPNFDEEPFFIPLFGGGKGIILLLKQRLCKMASRLSLCR
jgi:hypothetical protein